MKAKYYISLSLVSIIICLGLSILGGYPGHHIKFLVVSIVYAGLTYFLLSKAIIKKERTLTVLILFIPPFLIYIPLEIVDYSALALPSTLAYFIGMGFGILIYVSKIYLKVLLSILLITASVWMAFIGYTLWLHNINFGTFTGKVNYKVTCQIEGENQFGYHISNQDLIDKYIVIDFWNTHCGVCFHEFPEFQKLYNSYKNESNIAFLAINKPLKMDTLGQAFQMIKQRNYTFTTLVPVDEQLPEKLGIEYYPTIIIIDRQGMAIFRGSVERAGSVIQGIIKNGM